MGKRKLRWACLRCEAEYESRPPACGSCHLGNMLVPMPTRVAGRDMGIATRRRGGTVKAADMSATGRSAPYGEPWSNWRFGDPHTLLVHGEPGSGKTTLCCRLAVSAARRTSVLLVAAEQGHATTLGATLQRAGLDDLSGRRLTVSDARTPAELDEDLPTVEPDALVIIDSVSELRMGPEQLVSTLAGRSWIAIQHTNARGRPLGGSDFAYAADAVVMVAGGVATPTKNRWGVMSSIPVFDAKEGAS